MKDHSSAVENIHQLILEGASVSTDTRTLEKGSVFFALKGENFDANLFAAEAIQKGAAIAVVDDKNLSYHEKCWVVDDVLQTLQMTATRHRDLFTIPVIGITGSNGKTTTKELLNAVLSQKYTTLCTQGNLNNHIGVPLTLLRLNRKHQIAIIEMGANHVGEIEMLSNLAKPTFGMITNIGKAHIEGFGSVENIIKGKTELYRFLQNNHGHIFLNADNEILSRHADPSACITYGKNPAYQYSGDIVSVSPFLEVSFQQPASEESSPRQWHIRSNLTGGYNFENIMAAVAIGLHMGVPPQQIKTAIERYTPSNSRSQWKETGKNTLIMDAYNANPTSMKAALENFRQIDSQQPRGVILGDMLELGNTAESEHKEIVQQISGHHYDFVVLIGKHFSAVSPLPQHYRTFPDTAAADVWMKEHAPENHIILLKGSRGIGIEKLEKFL